MTTSVGRFTISPEGPFSLHEAALFGFGGRSADDFDGTMRMAFCLDGNGYARQVGVALTQDESGAVHGEFVGEGDPEDVRAHVTRVLSLDRDAREFVKIGDRDPVMARLLTAASGLRPVLFYSPYEAAMWSVLSARRPARQMAAVRERLSSAYGTTFAVAGQTLAALPTPEQMLSVTDFENIPDVKLECMRRVAEAALRGDLDVARLRAMEPEAAMLDLQRIDGIGPFYSALIVIRALGHADVLPANEPRALALAGRLCELGHDATPDEMERIALPWRPFRTWATVLLRAAGPRLILGAPWRALPGYRHCRGESGGTQRAADLGHRCVDPGAG